MRPNKVHYGQAANEVANGTISSELLAMAVAEALGDEQKANAIYLRLRAEEIARDEIAGGANKIIRYCIDSVSEVIHLIRITLLFNLIGVPIFFVLLVALKVGAGILGNLSTTDLLLASLSVPTVVAMLYEGSGYDRRNKSKT